MSGAAGGSQILREFLMRLGYEEDEQSRRKFTDAIKSMTLTVAALGTAMVTAAAGVVAGVRQMASNADAIYFVSQRTKASAADIRALESAYENLGGTAGQARSALEKLGAFIRASPGNVNYLESLTGQKWKDAATGMEQLSAAFQKQIAQGTDISVVFQEAAAAGLSEADVLVLLQKDFAETSAQYRAMADKIIGDSKRQQEIVENAHQFMRAYRALSTAVDDFAVNFGDMLGTKLKPIIDRMRQYLEDHSKEINAFLERASGAIIGAIDHMERLAESASILLGKLYEWYQKLSPAGQNVATAIGAIAAALVLFNTAIGRSPIIRLGVLAYGLVELYNSYEKWKTTGEKGIIDWEKWEPGIQSAIGAIQSIASHIHKGVTAVGDWTKAFEGLIGFMTAVWAVKMLAAIAPVALALAPILLAMGVFAAAAAAGAYIAHSIEDTLSENDRAMQMAGRMNLTASGVDEFGRPTGYQDKSGRMYTTAELAGMYVKRQGPDNAEQAKIAREGYDQYIAMGATPAMAAGLIAQEKRESGFDAGAIGDNGEARGLYQHHKWRRDKILEGTGIDMATASAADQRRGVWWEGHNTERIAFERAMREGEGKAGLTGAALTRYYERPGDIMTQAPIGSQLATEYDAAFAGKPAGTVPSTSPTAALAAPNGADIAALLYATPGLAGGVPPGGGAGAGDSSTTVNQTNNIQLPGVKYDDPRAAAAAISGAVGNKTAQAARNNSVNVK